MITPFLPDELFEINDNLEVTEFGDYIIVDNLYANYDSIKNILNNASVPIWKTHEGSKNFNSYYDCRLKIQNSMYGENYRKQVYVMHKLIHNKYGISVFPITTDYEFNYFKHIEKNLDQKYQHHPHTDSPFAAVVFMDSICSGGIAFYDISNLENKEHENLMFDVSGIKKTLVEAKPNRMVIFRGNIYHGGYIEDNSKYIDDWRITQVFFFDEN